MKKRILGTSDPCSTSHLSHRPSEPGYHIVDCRILNVMILCSELKISLLQNTPTPWLGAVYKLCCLKIGTSKGVDETHQSSSYILVKNTHCILYSVFLWLTLEKSWILQAEDLLDFACRPNNADMINPKNYEKFLQGKVA